MDINDFFSASKDLFAQKQPDGLYKEKLTLKAGNEYLVRLLPYLKEGKDGINKTSFHFWQYAWPSIEDGRWQYVMSPKTWGEKCPITDFYFKAKNSENPDLMKKIKPLSYKEICYYNVYVVNDPTSPQNNGTVKILQAGKQLNSIILEAVSDDEKLNEKFQEEFEVENMRNAIFDLSANGINLCIDVQDQGGFSNYKSSRFIRRKRDLGLTTAEIAEIHDKVFDLTTLERHRTTEEVVEIFGKTFLGMSEQTSSNNAGVLVTPTNKVAKESSPDPTEGIDLSELEDYLNTQVI